MPSKDNKFTLFYETAFHLQRSEVTGLFQRLSFFLIGTAFLVTALAAVSPYLLANNPNDKLVLLGHIITALGYYAAFFFLFTNYLNTRIIRLLGDYIRDLEEGASRPPPHLYLEDRTSTLSNRPLAMIWDLIVEVCGIFLSPFKFHKKRPAPHTWLLPLGFVIFWTVVWFLIVPTYEHISWSLSIPILGIVDVSLPLLGAVIVPLITLILSELLYYSIRPLLTDDF